MKITNTAIHRPVTTFMFFLAIILLGLVSLQELSVDLLPDISYPRLSVIARYPGVAPEEIETLVTRRLESSLLRIPGIRRVESVSEEGGVYMTLEFAWGTHMDFAMLHTREKLDSVELPEEMEEPTIIPLDPQSQPIMVLSVSGGRSLLELREFSEELIKPRLEQIEGIGSAEIAGGVEREIQVKLDPRLITLYGLDIQDISQRIEAFNRSLAFLRSVCSFLFRRSVTSRSTKSPRRSSKHSSFKSGIPACSSMALTIPLSLRERSLSSVG